jgi:hypothetical protein
MKKNLISILSISILIAYVVFLLPGCSKDGNKADTQKYTYTVYTPVYKSRADVIAGINGYASTPIEQAGKLYIKDNFIYVNEINKGIHIINNSDPSNPVQVAFLSIPGNIDIAIKGNILYADMYDELLALDITDPHHAKLTNTIKNFFTERTFIGSFLANTDDEVAVDWSEKDTTVEISTLPYPNCMDCLFETMNKGASVPAANSTGTAGSMASMVVMNNYLYAISERHSLGIIDISNPSSPQLDSSFFAGYDLETIYPFEDKLFLGSQIGVFMYDVSDPKNPVSVGQFEHGRACDPVIADGNYAYVTLHAGTECGGDANELDVIDISNITNSQLVKSYDLESPKGLSKDGSLLFVCDSTNVKVFNAADPLVLTLTQTIASKSPYDVIAENKKLIVVNVDGLYQYDYSNINAIKLLSFIAAKK